MNMRKQDGFHVLLLGVIIIAIAIAGVLGVILYKNFTKNTNTTTMNANTDTAVRWEYNQQENEWFVAQGTAPACKEPFVFDHTPVDLHNVNNVGFPGTYRGKDYKVHGTFALGESSIVKLPAEATLSGMVRYLEGNPAELQYKVNFEMDCGISFYFDHLYALSPQLQALADTLPEPRLNDTRVNPNEAPPRIIMRAGDIVATATGSHQLQRYGIDFGVIDYRKPNAISHNQKWATLHDNFKATEWYGVCWFAMLPGDDAEKAKQLSAVQFDTNRTAKLVSDYCTNAEYKTVDLFEGLPVDRY